MLTGKQLLTVLILVGILIVACICIGQVWLFSTATVWFVNRFMSPATPITFKLASIFWGLFDACIIVVAIGLIIDESN
jgi:hypothetical protein